MNKRIRNQVLKTVDDEQRKPLFVKLLVECWNDDRPHFGGGMPHRYDGKAKRCSYCDRPINWKPINAGYIAGMICEDD